jgi:hypothetical protein
MADTQKNPETTQQFGRAEMFDQLSRAADLRSSEDLVLWAIFGAFWGTNSVLLVALFASGTFPINHFVGIVVATVGILLSVIWHIIQRRCIGHIKRFEMLIDRLERKLEIPPDCAISARINTADYAEFVERTPIRARTLMHLCSLIATGAWFVALGYFTWLQAAWPKC